nr:hypothetical protein [Tanacetum cinerariifolium]
RAARANSTNYVNNAGIIVNTASTPVNTASISVKTASPLGNVSAAGPSYVNQDDSQIPSLEDIYEVLNDGIFTSASYNDEGAGADFTNLESTEELLRFKTQQVWILVDLPFRKKVIITKWVYRNKNDERGVVVRNKASLVAQGHRQEEGIDYDKVFAPVARIEAIRIFFAFASYMEFIVYQMDVKSAFLYGKNDEEVYVSQPLSFTDPKFPKKVYKVVKALFQMSSMGELTFFLGLQKFDFTSVKTASTPIETKKPLVKDAEAADMDVHLYRSMTGFLMYLTASRPNIMIFRYLKGQPKLGLWYSRESAFDMEAYSDSDYAGANLDRKSTTEEVEYVAAARCCRQVLWIQNQMLDYGFNLMNTKIYIDSESTICIVKNPVFHSKTKHIEIRHHFIRNAYEKKLIQVLKIHTDDNVADLLTKAFDVSRWVVDAMIIFVDVL